MRKNANKYTDGFSHLPSRRNFNVANQRPRSSLSYGSSPQIQPNSSPGSSPKLNPLKDSVGLLQRLLKIAQPAFAAVLVLFSVVSQAYLPLLLDRSAELDANMRALTGDSRDDTGQYFTTQEGGDFKFAVPAQNAAGEGEVEHTGRHDDAYELYASKDAKQGITVTEKTSKIAVTLIPQFHTNPGEKVDGDHLVYTTGPNKLVYTLKYNGLKEDIIVPEYHADELSYAFTLRLPAGVEARKDASGTIGIYSSDPTLFGDISYGSDADRERVEKARMNGDKTHLVMTIPAPLIKDAAGNQHSDTISFDLSDKTQSKAEELQPDLPSDIPRSMVTTNDYTLTLTATQLKDLPYPISLDPTFQVSDANDFSGVMAGDGTLVDASEGVIKRMPLTGGVLNTWTTDPDTTLPQTGPNVRFYAYNGNMYYFRAGFNIQRAPISASGDLGAFVDTGVQTLSSRHAFYNQYVYGTWSNAWQVGRINDDGSITAIAATTMHTPQGGEFEVNAYNGYLYLSGGGTTSGCPLACSYSNSAAIQYAQIYADGTLSAWASAGPNFTGARRLHQMPIYNGYIYIIAGWQGQNGSEQTTVNYAKLQANGTISSWSTTTSTAGFGAQTGAVVVPLSGYMYKIGGYDASNQTAYAQINADGTLGAWTLTTSINGSGRGGSGWAVYDGKIYIAGGAGNNGSNQYADIQYVEPKPAGWISTTTWQTTTPMPGNRYVHATVVYDGYIYHLGGSTALLTNTNTVIYAPLNSDGTVGTWNSTTSFTTARFNLDATAYRGYMYIFGGTASSGTFNNMYAPINSDGTLGTWNNVTAHPTSGTGSNVSLEAVAYNGYMYILGGLSSQSEVYYASINSNGTLNAWNSTNNLPGTMYGGRAELYGNRLYYIGNEATTTIYSAPINSNGTVGSWTLAGNLPVQTEQHGAEFYNGCLYVVGGGENTTVYNTARFSCFLPGDSIGVWQDLPTLSHNQYRAEAVLHNGYLYYSGGSSANSTHETTTHYTRINNGGSGDIYSWSGASNTPVGNKQKHSMVAYDGYLYVVGGCNAKPCTNAIGNQSVTNASLSAPISADGKIGIWTTRTFLNSFRAEFSLVQANGYLYAIGGCSSFSNNSDACNNVVTTVEYAKIQGNGVLSAWTLDSTNLIHPSSPGKDSEATVHNNRIYLIPGLNVATVKYTNLNPATGAISAWTSVTALPSARGGVGFFAVGNYLYVIGGCTNYTNCGTSGNTTSQVLVAQINSDGTLGTWVQKGTLPIASMFFGDAQVVNGYVYLPGGYGFGINGTNTVIGTLLSEGGITDLKYASATFTTRSDEATTSYNGRLYTSGGATSGTIQNYMQDAPLQSIPRVGSFTRSYQFNQAVRPTTLITKGTVSGGSVINMKASYNQTCNNSTYANQQTGENIELGNDNRVALNPGSQIDNIQCMHVRYTLNDSRSAVFPDEGNETEISEIMYYFHPSPAGRLRGGRTFINEADRGLDAQPD